MRTEEFSEVTLLRAGEDNMILMLKMIKLGFFLWTMKRSLILSKIKSNMLYRIVMIACVTLDKVVMISGFLAGLIVVQSWVARMSYLKG